MLQFVYNINFSLSNVCYRSSIDDLSTFLLALGMDVYEQLATRIRKLRNQRKWSQEVLADHSDLHRTYISHIENARREISLETVCKIAKGFGMTPSKLMTGITLDP